MQPTQVWNKSKVKQCEQQIGQVMLRDEHTLARFSEDFGHIMHSEPAAVCIPKTAEILQKIIQYANSNHLPITIRGNGMSQSGQSLATSGGLIISMEALNAVCSQDNESIWVEANTSWTALLEASLAAARVPPVVPYNCNLSVAGVLSAGGIGASSFKYGSVTDHVQALDVITAKGDLQQITADSPLFHACLGGQGRFGVINRACIKLRPCKKNVRTFFLVYLDRKQALHDLDHFKTCADYIEFFCSPSIQGARLTPDGRRAPFAEWLFGMHVSLEYEQDAPELESLTLHARPWKILHTQDEGIASWLHRHDSRFQGMKLTGSWELPHLWYECFIKAERLSANLDDLLAILPLHYANVLQLVPVKNLQAQVRHPGKLRHFFILPDAGEIFAVMILNPGLPPALLPGCMETVKALDERLLKQGGKRYLSGFLGSDLKSAYWRNHFNSQYDDWVNLKQQYDPEGMFRSLLYTEG